MGPLGAQLLWLALCEVALPIDDGLQPPQQGLKNRQVSIFFAKKLAKKRF
jgi:hypothetical protein